MSELALLERCQRDPVFHIEQVQGVDSLEPYQKNIAQALVEHDRVAISACHSVGKTFTMSKLVLWFGSSFPRCKIITTAPTFNQVKRLLWSEIRSGWKKSKYPLGGDMLLTEWKLDDDWFALGFTSRTEVGGGEGQGSASSFQGFHAPYVLVVFDEATGVPPVIWRQAEGLLTSGKTKFVAIANPTSNTSEFAKILKSRAWHKIYLSCFDSPNLTANGFHTIEDIQRELTHLKMLTDEQVLERLQSYKIVQPNLLAAAWVMEMALEWGIEHPLFVSKILGRLPKEGDNVLIPLERVELAQARHENETEIRSAEGFNPPVLRTIGVDPARFGVDKTLITVLDGTYQTHKKVMTKFDTGEVTGAVVALVKDLPRRKREVITVDGTGLGAGVVDQLKNAKREGLLPKHIEIRELHFGAACKNPKDRLHFANLKARMFKLLSDDLRDRLAILPEAIYQGQLPTVLFKFTPKGQMLIESKDEYKKRTGLGSPDEADSLALANFGRYSEDEEPVATFSERMSDAQRSIEEVNQEW